MDANENRPSYPPEVVVVDTGKIGAKAHVPARQGASWVQTERAAHEAWAKLSVKKPLAAGVMHVLIARMGPHNALVISQKTLAAVLGVTDRSVRSAIAHLIEERWLQVVRLNGPGTVAAYVVNSVVAWSQKRENLHLAAFTATVVACADDQKESTLEHRQLRKIPMIYARENLIPVGPSDGQQQSLEGIDPPDMPAVRMDQQPGGD